MKKGCGGKTFFRKFFPRKAKRFTLVLIVFYGKRPQNFLRSRAVDKVKITVGALVCRSAPPSLRDTSPTGGDHPTPPPKGQCPVGNPKYSFQDQNVGLKVIAGFGAADLSESLFNLPQPQLPSSVTAPQSGHLCRNFIFLASFDRLSEIFCVLFAEAVFCCTELPSAEGLCLRFTPQLLITVGYSHKQVPSSEIVNPQIMQRGRCSITLPRGICKLSESFLGKFRVVA